jgi:signal peptidase I
LKRSHLVRDILETAALALLIFVVMRFVIQSYHVQGVSMQPTLQSDEYVIVNKMAYTWSTPQRGDVIVFHYPKDQSEDFIKRVIGLPGDIIQLDKTHVIVNGVQLNEPYISIPANPVPSSWTVPAGQYFVLGDNRPASDDSRYWGYVPKDLIVGKSVVVYWPFSGWQMLNNYSTVYAQIPSASK